MLFEQYEQASTVSSGYLSGRPVIPEMTTAGIINANFEEETPMFSKTRINFSPSDYITHMVVCNNYLVLGMKSKIRRINLIEPDNFDDFDLQRSANEKIKIYDLFLDNTGKHLLICLVSPENGGPIENLYFSYAVKKPQPCSKMKGHVISSVAWNHQINTENTTDSILIGTTKGLIFETELLLNEERPFYQTSPEQYWKQVFDINLCSVINNSVNSDSKITGLVFHRIAGDNYFVLATTPNRLFQFIGNANKGEPPLLQNIFNSYRQDIPESFTELPGELHCSNLQLFSKNPREKPISFAWMTEPGVMYGNINYNAKFPVNLIGSNKKLLFYSEDKGEKRKPLSLVLTEFHILLLFIDRLKIMSILNEQLVFEDIFTETYGPLKGILKDPEKGTIWAFSDMAIYKYKVIREDRYVWEVYLEKKLYDLAKRYCKNDPVKIDKVLSKQAEDLFINQKYEESAMIYAQTYTSFEEIALKFLEAEQEVALRKFLLKKLEGLKNPDKTQITMIVMWLIEIYLNKIGIMRTAGQKNAEDFSLLQAEFHKLLKDPKVKECASNNRSTIYGLMSSHGDEENLICFTNIMRDFEKAIQYHLQHKNYNAALTILAEHSRPELFYQFSPALIQVKPRETVNAWIAQDHRLNPVQLIPALVQYENNDETKQCVEAIRYLEYCVDKMNIKDKDIHNYLLTLYANLHQIEKLMAYLQRQDEATIPYDQKYALRICSEKKGLEQACIHIYMTMGLYEEAVDLALKIDDIELSKQNADRPEDNDELRKKLWLKIAKRVVEDKKDIRSAMEFLQKCELIKIEDILPFFPDFVTIDHFKDAICCSLQEYNHHIEGLKEEMELATQSALEIRTEIQTYRNNYSMVEANEKCSLCNYPIMSRSFYLFPCKHLFHNVCVIAEILPHLTKAKQNRVEEIQRQLASLVGQEDTASLSSASLMSAAMSTKDRLNAELDELVASECLYCGDIMIRSIDTPFLNMSDYAAILQSWE